LLSTLNYAATRNASYIPKSTSFATHVRTPIVGCPRRRRSETRGKNERELVAHEKRETSVPRISRYSFSSLYLQPIWDSVDRQPSVDLSSRAVFRIGRSPQSDVQLMHATSSRRHAMLFHHSNGSCYIVDCGSAHGTYVNGIRVTSPPNGGVVVPHKIRQGSLIRFGGQGAPCFMLKSFSFELESMRDCPVSAYPTLVPSTPDMSAVVEHNTRLNALGKTSKHCLMVQICSKRSFESLETVEEDERCPSPPMSPEQVPMRLVSPDSLSQPSKKRRVTFSEKPLPPAVYPTLVSPDVSSDEQECE
jgi:pSer/pThr/pTyr-binding forkhead associated (FHA) protein